MTDEIDEVKVFRKTDKEEAADGDIDQDPLSLGDVATNYPVASSSTGSLMPPGFGAGGLAAFSPLAYFSPGCYPSPVHPALPMMQTMMMHSPAYILAAYNMQMAANANNPAQQNGSTTPKSAAKMKSSAMKENRENHKDRIKKPLNAFMIFMQEMRPKLLQEEEFANMQSAELNRELGKRWTALDEAEQKVYFEKYRLGKAEHEKLYPNWSARDNYTVRRRRAAEKKPVQTVVKSNYAGSESSEPKKCRALFGVNNQAQWCRHCKRKKKCLLVRTHDNDDNSSSRDTSPTTPLSNVDLPDVHNPQPGPAQHQPPSMPLTTPFGNLSINENQNQHQQHPNVAQDVKPTLPLPPQPSAGMAPQPQQPMNPMMAQFGMPFPMYPFNFSPFMGMQMQQHLMSPGMGGAPIKTEYGIAPPIGNADMKP
uniref:HMG box domain-containing protein n=1 Tax=Panagrellus redivivus TaxID=6233 RepID=A0A7E4UPR5_PANRE